jgi:hypothetical protein
LPACRGKIIIGMGAAGRRCSPDALERMLHDYQRKRILTLIDPTTDPLGRRLSHHPVDHRHRFRRHLRQGLLERHPNSSRIHSRKSTPTSSLPSTPKNGAAGQCRHLVFLYTAAHRTVA